MMHWALSFESQYCPLCPFACASFVSICLREGGARGRNPFSRAMFGPNQIRRRRKTRIYHVRRRFTTQSMAFNVVTDSTVTWAGTIDIQRTPFTKARARLPRRRARRGKKPKHKKATIPRRSATDSYEFNFQGIYVPTTWTIQQEEPPDRTSERLSRWFGTMEELEDAIFKPWPRKGPDPLAQFHAIRVLSGSPFSKSHAPKKRMQKAMIAAAKLTGAVPSQVKQGSLPPLLQQRMSVYLNAADDADLPVVIDTGASTSLTPRLEDFDGPIKDCETTELNGLSSTTTVVGVGMAAWTLKDVFGVVRTIRTRAYYVPEAQIRLFSPQTYFQEQAKGELSVNAFRSRLTLHDGSELEFPFHPNSNLPLMLSGRQTKMGLAFEDVMALSKEFDCHGLMSVADEVNQNVTQAQRELLTWHWKLGHANFEWIQDLCRDPKTDRRRILRTRHRHVSSCPVNSLRCAACQLGKQRRRGANTQHTNTKDGRFMVTRSNNLRPGDCVSLDQYDSTLTGRLPHTRGKEPKKDQYTGGTLFIDHATGLMHCVHQVSLNTGETIEAKLQFERFAQDHGVTVKSYLADNAPFGNTKFVDAVKHAGQSLSFSGVGAHHQNGVAERGVRTVTSWARTMMLHAVLHWPEHAHDLSLWPFALNHAVWMWNNLPKRGSFMAPLELFSGTVFPTLDHLHRSHVWGCPVYVLDPKIQDGKKLPKWSPRARRGQYLGVSPDHSSTVGLILNIATGYVSPQYHVVYDDLFSSVPNAETGGVLQQDMFTGSFWDQLVACGLERIDDGDFEDEQPQPPPLHQDWLTPDEIDALRHQQNDMARINPLPMPPILPPRAPAPEGAAAPEGALVPLAPEGEDNGDGEINDGEPLFPPLDLDVEPNPPAAPPDDDPQDLIPPLVMDGVWDGPNNSTIDSGDEVVIFENEEQDVEDPVRAQEKMRRAQHLEQPDEMHFGRGKRARKPNPKYAAYSRERWKEHALFGHDDYARLKVKRDCLNDSFLARLDWTSTIRDLKSSQSTLMSRILAMNTNPKTGTVEAMHPMFLITKADAADNPRWNEAMSGPDAAGFMEACKKEIDTLFRLMKAWIVVDREPWMNVIPSTWAFKRKRFPDGTVKKLKARFCARGDYQVEGIDFFDTFAPVVNWTTVRLMLILSIILNLATVQVDYTAAFLHAPIDRDPKWDSMTRQERERSGVYVEMPRGFGQDGKVLKLKRSLYGLKQAPRNFFQHFKGQLERVGFVAQDSVDPCLFISDKVIAVVYVDDTLFYSPKREYIDEVLNRLKTEEHAELDVEDSVAGFLGVHIERDETQGTIKLVQKGLIKRILEALQVGDLDRSCTPALSKPLIEDKNGDPPQGRYNYASVIGMLQYLQAHSRPDITYAVSQCARFAFSPKRSHEQAVEKIGQYLKHTQDQGLILKPATSLDIDCFVDADFAGLWPYEEKLDSTCVKSRTGFVICLANCPMVWTSKLQTSIALSTMEAEYNALSESLKSVLPLQELLTHVAEGVGLSKEYTTTFKTTIWEDNMGALTLANLEPGRITPRSKYYAVKIHWFRQHISDRLRVVKVDTTQQRADILTKGLTQTTFEHIRKLLCGW